MSEFLFRSKYLNIALVEMQNSIAYITAFAFKSSFLVLILFIFFNLWSVIYAQNSTPQIAGLTFASLMWYFVVSEGIGATKSRVHVDLGDKIRSGDIAYVINKPYSLFLYSLSSDIGYRLISVTTTLLLMSFAAYLLVGYPSFSAIAIISTLISLMLAMVLQFAMYFCIAMLTFWLEETRVIEWITQKLLFIIGGVLIPVSFLPPMLQKAALLLPFSYMSYAPAQLLTNFSNGFFISTIKMQAMWLSIFIVFAVVLQAIGFKKVSVNGG